MSIFSDKEEEINALADSVGGDYTGTFQAEGDNTGIFTWVDSEESVVGDGVVHIMDDDGIVWNRLELVPAAQQQGLMTRIAKEFPVFWLDNGLTRSIVPCPTNDVIRNNLKKYGFTESEQGFWSVPLTDLIAYHEK